jgi:beta-xylosidase
MKMGKLIKQEVRSQLLSNITVALLVILCATIALGQRRASYSNPALAGDFPDPSVIRVGQDYWSTATSSEWAPEFPILHSRDLVNWQVVGAVFQRRPVWSTGNYWAPEIAEYRGRFYVYYVGHKRDGPLCVAVATARRPAGPYTDHGPLVCQDAGSIDAMPVTDENGERFLVWKEDGNSRNLPTPIWAQRLSANGTKLVGERKELIRNDASWEAQLVEGPFIQRRGGWFYMFYSGNACCGRECNYALGVARSRKLLGPWEKNPANPILKGNETWKCPGHGSIVQDQRGRDFLLYHAYNARDFVYVGREGLLDEVSWKADGWPTINDGKGPSVRAPAPFGIGGGRATFAFKDEFTSARLMPGWQWPQHNEPLFRVEASSGGRLILSPRGEQAAGPIGAVMARSTTTGNYVAQTLVDLRGQKAGALVGLSAYGDHENALGLSAGDGKAVLWRREKNQHEALATINLPPAPTLHLRMKARDGHMFRFAVSRNGRDWQDVGAELDGSYLPPWDRGVRVALTAGGVRDAAARFEWLSITPVR